MEKRTDFWPNGCSGAVTLSYDDGVPVQFEQVAPLLEAHGLRATFYVTVLNSLIHYPAQWKAVAAAGHELGNHSLFHPCYNRAVFNWLDPAYDLVDYTEKRWRDEMAVANFALWQVDGQTARTYGNTCYNNQIGPVDAPIPLEPMLPQLFEAARGEQRPHQPVNLAQFNRFNLGTTDADGMTFAELRAEIEGVVAQGGWIIYTMHGVGQGTHNLYIDEREHRRLVEWLGAERNRIWTAPLLQVARHISQ